MLSQWVDLDADTVLAVAEAADRQQRARQVMCASAWCNRASPWFSVPLCTEMCLVPSPAVVPDPGLGTYVGGYGGWWYGPPGQRLDGLRPAASGASASRLAVAGCV